MADFIDRQATMNAVGLTTDAINIDPTKYVDAQGNELVAVVRCKDCSHYDEPEWTCLLHEANMKPTDFCSYGEINGVDRERDNH